MRLKTLKLNNKGWLLLILLNLNFGISAYAQDVRLLVSNDPEKEGQIINVKWISDQILFDEGVNLYRRPEGKLDWVKLNNTPILPGQYSIPPEAFKEDSTLQEYVQITTGIKPADLQGMVKAYVILKAVYSNEYSKFLGIMWDDNTVSSGNSYRYMLKGVKGDKEELLAFSDVITAGPYVPEKPIENVQIDANNRKANFKWKVDNERFHSVNIYRSSAEEPQMVKQNELPIVLSQRPGPGGRMEYPKHYFTQNKLKNGLEYTYRMAGIDFFGRETELSKPLMVNPRDTIPPPSPEALVCKVKLLEIDLEWTPKESEETIGLNIYRKKSVYDTLVKINNEMLSPLATRFHDVLPGPGNYYYQVAAIDESGNRGYSNLVMAQSLDIYPPATPRRLVAVADTGKITLTWNVVHDADLLGYRLYRTIDADNEEKYNLMNSETIVDTVFTDKLPFNARNKFYYVVVAVDSAYNMSPFSKPVKSTLPDIAPPENPFIKKVEVINNQGLDVSWVKNFDIDLLGYNLFRDQMLGDSVVQSQKINKSILGPDKLNFLDLTADKDVLYNYYLRALDSAGNRSGFSNRYPAIIQTKKVQTVEELKNISVKYNEKHKEVKLSWQVPGNNDFKGVVIFKGDSDAAPMNPVSGLIKDDEFTDDQSKMKPGMLYYRFVAYFNSGKKWESGRYAVEITKEENK